jgi:1-deoxy-D-xylulose-5-phosphate synthase
LIRILVVFLYKGRLSELRASNGTSENNIFKFLGFDYTYVEDGNDIVTLIHQLRTVKDIDHPVVLHVHTRKGKGFELAKKKPEVWHYHVPFSAATGEDSSSLVDEKRPLIVGLVEGASVAFASGIAKRGVKPFIVAASTFIQRAYDQVIQDWTLNDTPAALIVHGAGISSSDYTHVGIYDIPMLANVPNLVYLAPTSRTECRKMFDWTSKQNFPTAARAWSGSNLEPKDREVPDIEFTATDSNETVKAATISGGVVPDKNFVAKSEVFQKGGQVAILGLGLFFSKALEVAKLFEQKLNIRTTVINPRFISHLDEELLGSLPDDHHTVVVLADGVVEGGFGQRSVHFMRQVPVKARVQDVYCVEQSASISTQLNTTN